MYITEHLLRNKIQFARFPYLTMLSPMLEEGRVCMAACGTEKPNTRGVGKCAWTSLHELSSRCFHSFLYLAEEARRSRRSDLISLGTHFVPRTVVDI